MDQLAIRQSLGLMSNNAAAEFFDQYYTLPVIYDSEDLYDMAINHLSYVKDKQRVVNKVLEIYEEVRRLDVNGLPALVDIMCNVVDYNESIFYNLAVVQAIETGAFIDIQNSSDPEASLEDAAMSVTEMFVYNLEYTTVNTFVFGLLRKHKLSFTVSEDDEEYDGDVQADFLMGTLPESGKSYRVVVGDCQNILLDCFGIEGCFLQDDLLLWKPGE